MLFQHIFGTHRYKPLPTGYQGILFIGERGISLGCALEVCCNFLVMGAMGEVVVQLGGKA